MAGISRTFSRTIKRVQSNNIALSPGEAGPETYSLPFAVSTRAWVAWKGKTVDATAFQSVTGSVDVRLTHSTTGVTARRIGSTGEVIVEFDVVDPF